MTKPLFSPSGFRDLVSGRRRGLGAMLWRVGLRAAEVPYTAAVGWRNRRYDTHGDLVHDVPVPVVSVGNLTLGGTGKTPMVRWIAKWFSGQQVRVAVISRGYGARAGSKNDEALELEQTLPDVPHLENPDRVEAARLAVEKFESQLIVLDDAFQHRRIGRQLDIVLLDALEPFGFGHVFPRGTLREPVAGLRRADVIVLTRADMLEADRRDDIRRQVARYAPDAAWAEVTHAPKSLLGRDGRHQPLDQFRGKRVAAFCGIGNPAGFRHTLCTCGYEVVAFREFADHHDYPRQDIESLDAWADGLDVAAVLTTHKDLVKLGIDRFGRHPLRAVAIGLDFITGQEALEATLQSLLPSNG